MSARVVSVRTFDVAGELKIIGYRARCLPCNYAGPLVEATPVGRALAQSHTTGHNQRVHRVVDSPTTIS